MTTPITVSAASPNPRSSVPTSAEQVSQVVPTSAEQVGQVDDGPADGGSGVTTIVSGDTPWYRESLFFVIVSLAGAAVIVRKGDGRSPGSS